jgi:pimeloyl-ACP methyl ester carboxylesterase
VIKLPAADPSSRIGTLFVNFGGPGQSGVDRLRLRARWPWLFSEELRSRFDLVSWDQRAVSRSAPARCFSTAAEQWQFLTPSPGLPTDARGEQELFAWSDEFADRCEQHAGPILEHSSSANSARDLDLLRRAVGDSALTYHGISYGTQLGATYANLFPGRVRAMVLDGSIDFEGNVNGHGSEGITRYRCRDGRGVRGVLAGLFGSRPALCVFSRGSRGQVGGAARTVAPRTCHRLRSRLDLSRAGRCDTGQTGHLPSTG